MAHQLLGRHQASGSIALGRRQPNHSVLRHRGIQSASHPRRVACMASLPEALLFDCDGVLVDTEAEGHRVSFNEAFKRSGLRCSWDLELYGELLHVAGGKERMDKYFNDVEVFDEPYLALQDPPKILAELHKLKTDIFMEMISTGIMTLRPGVKRLVTEAIAAGVPVGVCSTSSERAVQAIVHVMLGEEVASKMRIFAGDMVPKKKPAPDIYLLAAEELGVNPAKCCVIEDSKIGLLSAHAAGMTCFITKSYYTQNEDFSEAEGVFECIGESAEEGFSLQDLAEALNAGTQQTQAAADKAAVWVPTAILKP